MMSADERCEGAIEKCGWENHLFHIISFKMSLKDKQSPTKIPSKLQASKCL